MRFNKGSDRWPVRGRRALRRREWLPRALTLPLLIAAAAACGDDDASGSGAGSGGGPGTLSGAGSGGRSASGSGGSGAGSSGAGTKSPSELAGAFTLQLVPQMEETPITPATSAQSSFIGKVSAGETPVVQAWVVDSESGGCTLYTPKAPFCDPSCGSRAVCVSDDKCVDNPEARTVGNLHLRGVGDSEIVMTPIANNYQPPAGTSLPFPPCAEGDEVTLAADGGEYSPFTLKAKCIAPLDFQGPIELQKGKALTLNWQAPGKPDLTRIKLRMDISHHGGSRGKIECDVADNGKLELATSLTDKLLELGVAGYPTVIMTRLASGGSGGAEPTKVLFNVQENVERAIEIEGLKSCTESSDCTAPATCQTDLTCK